MEAQTFDYHPFKITIPQLVINKQFMKNSEAVAAGISLPPR